MLNSGKEEMICDCCFNKTKSHISDLTREAADRSRLMAKIDRDLAEEGVEEEEEYTRDELFKGSREQQQAKGKGTGNRAAGANAAMAEAMQNIGERGEKLNDLNEKSAQLKDAAFQFKNIAGQLKKSQQEKNSFFGF